MISPNPLSKGSKVVVLSTARKISQLEIRAAVSVMENWGLKMEFGKNLFHSHHQFSGTKDERIQDLQNALDDPECEAIICARGGYGTVQLIDYLDFTGFLKRPKWIVCYSDVTVLQSHLQQVLCCESIHGIMPINLPDDGSENNSIKSLQYILFGKSPGYSFEN